MEYGHLSHADKQTYNQAIVQTHRRRIEVHVLTLDGNAVWSVSPEVTSGQITTDVTQTPMQVATLTFVDRSRSLVFEPQDVGSPTMHRQFMLRIIDSRFVAGLGWVDCLMFTGPIWDFERQGPQVTLTAHSVDRLASGTIRRAKMWRRKTKKTTVITGLLTEAGATRLRIPDLRYTTPVHVHVRHTKPKKKSGKSHTIRRATGFAATRQDTYWDKASGLGSSMNRLLFPTADGTFELRSHPERPVYHFNLALLADVDLKRPGSDGPNTFQVVGSKPKGSKRRVDSGLVGFPNGHPLSAESLAWHGKPYQILEQDQNPHCKTKAECRAIAIRKRDRAARMVADVQFDALPIPWLRPWDMVTAQAVWGVPSVWIQQMTYPLTPDESPMTIGAVKLATPRRRSA